MQQDIPFSPPAWLQRPLRIVPLFIGINVLVFFAWQLPSLESLMQVHFLISGERLNHGMAWTLISSAFSHYSFFHLAMNMIVFYSFGQILERFLGHKRFLLFYLLSAITASMAHVITSYIFMNSLRISALGASGVMTGLLMVFAMMFPKQKIVLFGIIPMPAIVCVLLMVGFDVYGLFAQNRSTWPAIGHGAHLGGTLFGLLYYLIRIKPNLRRLS